MHNCEFESVSEYMFWAEDLPLRHPAKWFSLWFIAVVGPAVVDLALVFTFKNFWVAVIRHREVFQLGLGTWRSF